MTAGAAGTAGAPTSLLTVSQVNQLIREIIERDPRLQTCSVVGEISNFKHHTSGHMYFTLKDEKSRLRAVMFSSRARNLTFLPKDGMRVIVTGSVGVFDRDGQYQIYVDDMQPDGIGALYVAFTQLKEKLEREGLFRADRKRPLPRFPQRIGVVTSPTGAVIRDICSTLSRRYPLAKVVLSPALVQGPTAAASIVAGIERLVEWSQNGNRIDVIIVARGGGSLEELWPFNEEIVARAIARCPIPVVSAVGHETDYTICDFVADVRAATPTAAAEVVAPSVADLREQLLQWENRSASAVRYRVFSLRQRLENAVQSPVLRHPLNIVNVYRQHVDYLDSQLQQHATKPIRQGHKWLAAQTERLHRLNLPARLTGARYAVEQLNSRLAQSAQTLLANKNNSLEKLVVSLDALNPLHVLRRGYSVVYKADGQTVVTSTRDVRRGELLKVRLMDGMVTTRVTGEEEAEHGGGIQSRLDI